MPSSSWRGAASKLFDISWTWSDFSTCRYESTLSAAGTGPWRFLRGRTITSQYGVSIICSAYCARLLSCFVVISCARYAGRPYCIQSGSAEEARQFSSKFTWTQYSWALPQLWWRASGLPSAMHSADTGSMAEQGILLAQGKSRIFLSAVAEGCSDRYDASIVHAHHSRQEQPIRLATRIWQKYP